MVKEVVVREAVVSHERGLTTRLAALLTGAVKPFSADVTVKHGSVRVDAKSLLGLLSLGARAGSIITIVAEGHDAVAAVDIIVRILQSSGSV